MKRMIAVMLCAMIALAGMGSAENGTAVSFSPAFTDSLELNANGWLESKELAELLTGSLTCDLLMELGDSSAKQLPSLNHTFFVGTSDGTVVTIICCSADEKCLVLTYRPGSADYTVFGEETDPNNNADMAKELLTEKYYTCSGADIKTYVSRVGVMMSADD